MFIKFAFNLKQHTPIIHFQHDEDGATLRASELKPKLDKFLLNYFTDKKIDYKNFLIKNTNAFNYKVKISIDKNKNQIIDLKDYKAYFGNMGLKEEEKRKGIINYEPIKVNFICYNENLQNAIKKNFPLFLILHNFGTRQNKGFGCFYLSNTDKDNYKDALEILNGKAFIYAQYNNTNSLKIAKNVSIIYSLMKSGLNFPDTNNNGKNKSYYKSILFEYMLEKGIGNEKRFIKENFFHPLVRIPRSSECKKYVRALLGISDGTEFKDRDRSGKITYSSKEIERFKSPILFKIIDDKLFVIPEEINKNIFDKTFNFNDKFQPKGKDIKIPDSFNLLEFLFYFSDKFNSLPLKTDNSKKNIFDKMIEDAKKAKFEKIGNTTK